MPLQFDSSKAHTICHSFYQKKKGEGGVWGVIEVEGNATLRSGREKVLQNINSFPKNISRPSMKHKHSSRPR